MKKVLEDKWSLFITTDGNEISASNLSVTTEALVEYWKSPRSIVPDKWIITDLEQVPTYIEVAERFLRYYGLCLCNSSAAHYVLQENLVTQVKQALTRRGLALKAYLKREHADLRHMCMAAAHGATFLTADSIGCIIRRCPEALNLGPDVVNITGDFGN